MKYASVTVLALALIPSGIVVACASGNDDQLFDGGMGGGGGASATSGASTGKASSSSSGGMCVSQCTTDADCQNSCPPVSPGSNCCDTATGICFMSKDATCPAPMPDAGDDGMPPY